MTLSDFLARLEHVKPITGGHMARCPAHQDDTASLSVTEGKDGRILLHCHANCETRSIVTAMALDMADLFPAKDRIGLGEPTAIYDYRDEHGTLRYQSLRYPSSFDGKKTFRQRRPDQTGGWIWKMEGVRRLVYRLNQLQGKNAVIIVEGEKDADRLWSLGLPATTNSGGAGKWRDDLTVQLSDAGIKRVVVLPDNDPPGEAHGLQIARSCDDAGLFVKRILLPDLPEKGDVSDWLDAGHTKAELVAIIKNAPPFKAHASVVIKPKLELTSLADLLQEPDDAIEWLVDDRIPGGGLVLLAGKPKAGKSTLARTLAFCVAAGEPWLGHHVVCGPVWYLALEDKRSEVRSHFRRMGATGTEPLLVLVGEAPQQCLELLQARAKDEKPILIIVDTLQRLIQVKDMSDYAEVTTKFSPLLKLCRETGAACVVVHHANKYGEGLDCILGSTALSGSVDNIFIMGRGEYERTLQSIQRIGDDLEPTVITHDHETGHMALAGSKREAEIGRAAELIIEALRDEPEAQTETWLRDHVEATPKSQAAALRMAVRRNWIYRVGEGRRGAPYVYGLVSRSPAPPKREYVVSAVGVTGENRQHLAQKYDAPDTSKTSNEPPKREYVVSAVGVTGENRQNQVQNADNPLSTKTSNDKQASKPYPVRINSGSEERKPEKTRNAQNPCTSTKISVLGTGNGEQSRIRAFQVSLVSAHVENTDGNGHKTPVIDSHDRTYSSFATSDNEIVDDSLFANPVDDDEVEGK
jgi:5S rRNA maturation endonuclease (ribonuclease M5)